MVEPRAGQALIAFVDEHHLGTAPFANVITSGPRYQQLRERLRDFKLVPGYYGLFSDLSAKPNAEIDKKATRTSSDMVFRLSARYPYDKRDARGHRI